MRSTVRFPTGHKDVIHDVAYDFYGKRLATCSSDRKIKVWDLTSSGDWKLSADWQAHKGSIWKLDWAHPEYGQVIASCSFDRTVCIWEEVEDERDGNVEGSRKKVWQLRLTLSEARESVTDVKFEPHQKQFNRLRLATGSVDGFVRIYEAIDVMDLSQWSLMEEFETHKSGSNSCRISWNSSSLDKPQMAVASDNDAKIWSFDDSNSKWHVTQVLSGHSKEVNDVSWAPNIGRTFHLVATASKDGTVRVWKFPVSSNINNNNNNQNNGNTNGDKNLSIETCVLKEHKAPVWRVEWNITGTILASSGDDSNVFLWKSNYFMKDWKPVLKMNSEEEGKDSNVEVIKL